MSKRLIIAIASMLPLSTSGFEFSCPDGEKQVIEMPDGITDYRCMLETETNRYTQVGPFVLIKNGTKILEANHNTAGELHGMWRTWSEEGELTSEGRYENGREEGVWFIREGAESEMQRKQYKQGVLQSP